MTIGVLTLCLATLVCLVILVAIFVPTARQDHTLRVLDHLVVLLSALRRFERQPHDEPR